MQGYSEVQSLTPLCVPPEKEAVRRRPAAFPGGETRTDGSLCDHGAGATRPKRHLRQFKLNILIQICFQSLPDEERDRVLSEEKMGGARLGGGVASSPHRAKSPSVKVRPCSSSTASFLFESNNLIVAAPDRSDQTIDHMMDHLIYQIIDQVID